MAIICPNVLYVDAGERYLLPKVRVNTQACLEHGDHRRPTPRAAERVAGQAFVNALRWAKSC